MNAASPSPPRMGRPPRASLSALIEREDVTYGRTYDRRVVRRLAAYLAPYRGKLLIGVGAVLLHTLTQLAIPLVIKTAIDQTLAAGTESLAATIAVFAFVVLLNGAASFLQDLVVGRTAEAVLRDLRRAMFAHLQRVPMAFFDKTQVGRLMSRLQGDVGALQEFLENSVLSIGEFVLLFGIAGVLLWLDLRLGLLTLSVVPALFVMRVLWLPAARRAFIRSRETSAIVNGALAENINGVRTVQAMRRESVNFDLFDERARENLAAQLWSITLAQIVVPIVDALTGVAMAIVVVVGGTFVLDGRIELGVMVASMFYVQRFFDPIRALTAQYSVMQRAMASGERIFEVIDVPVAIADRPGAVELTGAEASVELENVSFAYQPGLPVLRGVSIAIKPGETVALVGPTGSGKTSIAALIHRFYEAGGGVVRVGGIDVRDVTQASLGHVIGMVPQEPFLFTGTILDNIVYARPDATRAEAEAAARAVGAHEFVARLPLGYDTPLEQRGLNLSLGQRQLLSFARALVADTPILVLDEATASVDSYTERAIQQALARLLKGRTGIVIAHRLATIRNADRIVVLRDGQVAETGTHDELLRAEGLYAALYAMNFASFDDLPEDVAKRAVSARAAS